MTSLQGCNEKTLGPMPAADMTQASQGVPPGFCIYFRAHVGRIRAQERREPQAPETRGPSVNVLIWRRKGGG